MKKNISLNPVDMTPEVMEELEQKGLIIRLGPGRHDAEVADQSTQCTLIYEPLDGFGPHKIMAVTVNRTTLPEFGTHPDNEDFFMIGDPQAKILYLVIALCKKEELDLKIREQILTSSDFIALKVRFNDPEVSFFTMLKDVPHGETVEAGEGRPATFYVAESRDMVDVDTDFQNYELHIG